MLDQALIALASAAGAAVASAAGTDAWIEIRARVASFFGRGGPPGAPQRALDRLDRSAGELESARSGEADSVRAGVAASWRARFEDLLEGLDDPDRQDMVERLRELVALAQQAISGVSAEGEGIAFGGRTDIRADNGSVAAVRMGDVSIGNPPPPGPDQG
ncbi:hypothetical protein ACIHEJ_39085 [Streptomyces sp. NPDC052301]|uniref:hypothetical protein n=1 Tax=Streptomyces sp. NPDC052301 TaxID=3365687 RepID=UPI0037D65D46